MPRFIIERNVGFLTPEEHQAGALKSIEVLKSMPGVTWVRSYVSDAEGKIYCEYDAPDEDAIREHARLAGFPADQISLVNLEVSPDMFV